MWRWSMDAGHEDRRQQSNQRCQCKSFLSLSSVDKDWPFFSTALI